MLGTFVGPYRLDAPIGAGAMGTVWRATVEGAVPGLAVGERVALKIVHPHLVADLAVFESFVREAMLGRAVRDENVVRTLDAGMDVTDDGEIVYLAMEHVVGRTLADVVAESGPVSDGFCRRVAREVARGLEGIHGRGIVHGDLKPANVLLTRDEVVKVTDLGLARLRDGSLRRDDRGRFTGTLLYAAPEQFAADQRFVDGRIDLFALGATLWEIAVGRHPWAAPGASFVPRQVEVDAPALRDARPDASEFLGALVAALLERDPRRRIASAAELSAIVAAAEDGPWFRARRKAASPGAAAPHVRGRESEIAALWRAVLDADAGRGGAVVVEGAPGIGTTRVVDEVVALAAAQPAPPVVLRAEFGGLRTGADVVDGLADRAARESALVLVVVQRADRAAPDAWAEIARLAAAARERRSLVVVTSAAPLPIDRAAALGGGRPAATIVLGPLDESAVAEVAADILLAGRPSPSLVRWIARRSGGNPGVAAAWVRELVRRGALRTGDDGDWTLASAPGLDDVPAEVVAWGADALRAVEPGDRDLVDAAASAGREFDAALVASVAGVAPRAVAARCAALERTGLLRRTAASRWEFSSCAAHAAARAAVPETLRAEYDRAFAEALLAREPRTASESADLVRHLAAAGDADLPPGDVARALAHLAEGGRPDEVVDLADLAIARSGTGPAAREARLRRAEALLALGRTEEGRRALSEALASR